MTQFKPGDKVKIVSPASYHIAPGAPLQAWKVAGHPKIGDVFTLEELDDEGDWISSVGDGAWALAPECLALVEPEPAPIVSLEETTTERTLTETTRTVVLRLDEDEARELCDVLGRHSGGLYDVFDSLADLIESLDA